MTTPKLLIIDDEPFIQHAFRKAFASPQYEWQSANNAAEGMALVRSFQPDVVVLDIHLPDAIGLETFSRIHEFDSRIPVILITGHGTTELAIEATKRGAFDYLLKPLELDQLRTVLERAIDSALQMKTAAVLDANANFAQAGDHMVGTCPAIQEVFKAIGRVAETNTTVLILGESGTGKELVARAIYQHSTRAGQPFLAVNCAALSDTLLESELFGHEKGSFTGADRQRIGKFEQCSGGTIFLDEVGELSSLTQAKLLRLLQEQKFERVGGTETISTNVRVIAATNANLEENIRDGRFRHDLYFRLNVFTIRLPALRDRGGDLHRLITYYAERIAAEYGKPKPIIPPETWKALLVHPWPGNIRELQNVLQQTILQHPGPVIHSSDLPPDFLPKFAAQIPTVAVPRSAERPPDDLFDWDQFVSERIAASSESIYADALLQMEREILTRVLKYTRGNKVQAAKMLGIARNSLRTKLRSLGLDQDGSEDDQLG